MDYCHLSVPVVVSKYHKRSLTDKLPILKSFLTRAPENILLTCEWPTGERAVPTGLGLFYERLPRTYVLGYSCFALRAGVWATPKALPGCHFSRSDLTNRFVSGHGFGRAAMGQ